MRSRVFFNLFSKQVRQWLVVRFQSLLIIITKRKAIKGNIFAQYKLGQIYEKLGGSYLPVSYAWFGVAASHGYPKAKEALSLLETKLPIHMLNKGRNFLREYKTTENRACNALMRE